MLNLVEILLKHLYVFKEVRVVKRNRSVNALAYAGIALYTYACAFSSARPDLHAPHGTGSYAYRT